MNQSQAQSQHLDALRTLVLKHEMLIRTWEERLDAMNSRTLVEDRENDGPSAFARAQLEFLILNAECIKTEKESQLNMLIEMQERQAEWEAHQQDAPSMQMQLPYYPKFASIPAPVVNPMPGPIMRIMYDDLIDTRAVKETRGYLRFGPDPATNGLLLLLYVDSLNPDSDILVDPATVAVHDWADVGGESQWQLAVTVPGAANLAPLSLYPDAILHPVVPPSASSALTTTPESKV